MFLFRNDYSQAAHPDVLTALAATNFEGNIGYGEDDHCARAVAILREKCAAPGAAIHFLVGGTQTNATAICAFLRPWESAISPVTGHINGHEVGAVEATGHKIIAVPVGADGKLRPGQIDEVVEEHTNVHVTLPRLVYISSATETGTVYTKGELTALRQCCDRHNLLLFVDGARLGAALASPGNDVTLADMAALTDAFYIGGTKNGALMGEALVIVNPTLQAHFFRQQKRHGAVLAKGWLLGVQFETLFQDDLYFTIARHAVDMAMKLQAGLQALGLTLLVESTTNQVFVAVDKEKVADIEAIASFEPWGVYDEKRVIIRLITTFATSEETVDNFLVALSDILKK